MTLLNVQGKATIKVSWNRLTAHCLKAAVNNVLPRYREYVITTLTFAHRKIFYGAYEYHLQRIPIIIFTHPTIEFAGLSHTGSS